MLACASRRAPSNLLLLRHGVGLVGLPLILRLQRESVTSCARVYHSFTAHLRAELFRTVSVCHSAGSTEQQILRQVRFTRLEKNTAARVGAYLDQRKAIADVHAAKVDVTMHVCLGVQAAHEIEKRLVFFQVHELVAYLHGRERPHTSQPLAPRQLHCPLDIVRPWCTF